MDCRDYLRQANMQTYLVHQFSLCLTLLSRTHNVELVNEVFLPCDATAILAMPRPRVAHEDFWARVTLRYLHLGSNYFSGAIPDEYGDMAELEYLHLGTNCLSGRVPASLGRLKRLREMYIGYDNQFDGPIPPEFGELEALVLLDMRSCSLTGPIPL